MSDLDKSSRRRQCEEEFPRGVPLLGGHNDDNAIHTAGFSVRRLCRSPVRLRRLQLSGRPVLSGRPLCRQSNEEWELHFDYVGLVSRVLLKRTGESNGKYI